ncbi:TPA: ABC transporter ATP-binding protein [Streptococcus equi subsp. zooepidemicus]|uniref:ABC transporter, ATP-binding/permease protein n=1 Tax=Streptococcus equi subsp. zooepidemicus (strain MGCS10565) TaxID=552526 RepID=B4U376_STREM|nr:ABC transporter ATP-binding protein [Streptococcus equi]ACG62443.1 ABC transporter, ATP-binding/permease protein [Streptococcus equi subsp. zooepidemicus MGCS10565]MCD3418044.1 ABC transporter ATP-binding protein/permease [Streptococcus equi subsp. zooepidemicus]MCD3418582.1 ABC transporter ATP-binding protein/permease [Streptococcus equi subsp. zooepidemicus]MCD3418588.1 ABC transporter ATP-binding protein/permease [Streptococcus equi subsp. zooepidemicus]MDI5918102.1 ABC transporter ATP-b
MTEKHVFRRIWTYLSAYRLSLITAITLKIVSAVMSVLEPFVLGLVITELSANLLDIAKGVSGAGINKPYIAFLLVLYIIRALVYELGSYGSNYFMTRAVQSSICDLRRDLSQKINRIPVSYFDKHQFGDMLGRFTSDVETVSNALQQSFLQIVNAFFTLILVIGMVLYINAPLASVVIIAIPLIYAASRFVLKKSQPYFKAQANILGEMNGFVQENLTGFNILKLYGREETSKEEFHQITERLQEVGFKASFISGIMMPVLHFISDSVYMIVALIAGLQVIAGRLTIGNMQAFVQYIWQISQPIQTITQLAGPLQSAKSSLERIFAVLDETDELTIAQEHLEHDLTGQVSFNQVDFSYTAGAPLIRNFNLEVKPGEMIAIVGPTGAGKTTLINLLMRFYDVNEGSITVDGQDIRQLSRQAYRRQFGMVLQDAWLFEGSIQENLRFGHLEATDEQIIEAAKAANVDHFIRTLPGGYHMVMNQESSNISLGQKQLLTIARALLADPKLLILDEATSSVDTRLELLIQKAMKRLMVGRTSFVIAHRLSTIQEADKILVLKDGQIIEQGNHDSLLAAKGFYYELYHSQFKTTQS